MKKSPEILDIINYFLKSITFIIIVINREKN